MESTIVQYTSENDTYSPDPSTDAGPRKAPNTLSLQANTNGFIGINGHNDWVQFVMQSEGDPNDPNFDSIAICIWNIDFDVYPPGQDAAVPPTDAHPPGDYRTGSLCVGGNINSAPEFRIAKRPGPYKPFDYATIAGSTYNGLLGMVAQLSWWDPNKPNPTMDPNSPTASLPNFRGLYSVVVADKYGLANNWTDLSGSLIGMCSGARAIFDAPAAVVTRLLAGSCDKAPSPVPDIPWPGECPGAPALLPHTVLTDSHGVTAETNNLNRVNPSPAAPVSLTADFVYTEYMDSTDGTRLSSSIPQVFVRDSIEDEGVVPSNINDQPFWESPDIFLVPIGTKVVVGAESAETIVTAGGYFDIWVQVHNDFGCSQVTGAKALVYLADPFTLFGLSTPLISVTNGEYWGSTKYHQPGVTAPDNGVVVPRQGQALIGPFTFQAPVNYGGSGHKCILAAIIADGESPPSDLSDAPDSNQVAQRNVQFENCAYPLTNTAGVDGSLDLVLTVRPASVTPTLSGYTDIEITFDDPDSTWYDVWSSQQSPDAGVGDTSRFTVLHDGASTIVRLGSNRIVLNQVTLVANESRTATATQTVSYTSQSHAVRTLIGVQAMLRSGTTVLEKGGGSCQVTAQPESSIIP